MQVEQKEGDGALLNSYSGTQFPPTVGTAIFTLCHLELVQDGRGAMEDYVRESVARPGSDEHHF